MEDVSDKCWYCKAILPHHRRFGPLLRTTMSYEAIKRVFCFWHCQDGFVVVANPILLYCVSYHGEKCSNQGERSYPLGPALRIEKCSNQGSRSYPFGGNLGPALHIALIMILFREIKDRFLDRIRGACNARGRYPQRPPRKKIP